MKQFSKLAAGLIAATLMSVANAQFDTVKMLIPANPAGGWDQTGRNLAQAMQQSGVVKTVNFENKK